MALAWFSSPSGISDCSHPPYEERSWEGGDVEPSTPQPPNHVFCTYSRRQLIDALIANRLALEAPVLAVANDGVASATALISQIYKLIFGELNSATHFECSAIFFSIS